MAAGKSRVIYAGRTRFPYLLSDDYTRRPSRCPYPLSDDHKRRVPHTTRYPEDMTKCRGSKRKNVMVHNAVARRVLENMGTHIFLKRGTTHNPAVQWSLKKLGTWCGFFMAITLYRVYMPLAGLQSRNFVKKLLGLQKLQFLLCRTLLYPPTRPLSKLDQATFCFEKLCLYKVIRKNIFLREDDSSLPQIGMQRIELLILVNKTKTGAI